MRYYVYHNRRYRRAIIHLENCRLCIKGLARTPTDTASLHEWHGPFDTFAQAELTAQIVQAPLMKLCQHCLRKLSWRARCPARQ